MKKEKKNTGQLRESISDTAVFIQSSTSQVYRFKFYFNFAFYKEFLCVQSNQNGVLIIAE